MKQFLIEHFPANKSKFKTYFKAMIPIIIGSSLYALNGVVDNFMVGHIEQGQSALAAINGWTAILMGWCLATAAAGSVTMSQFYYDGNIKMSQQIIRYRFILSFIATIPLLIIAQTYPDLLTKTFLHKPKSDSKDYVKAMADYNLALKNAAEYARVISFQWLVISISFNFGNILREMGHGKITMIWGIGTLATNMGLNSILMYGVGMGVSGAAWASFAARIVAISVALIYIIKKKVPIDLNILRVFKISTLAQKIYWRRWVYFISVFTVIFFINYRSSIYSMGFPPGGKLGAGVHGLYIVGLTGSLLNIFTSTFSALATMSALFVGSELGKGNIKKAKINARELKGFNTLISLGLAMIAYTFTAFIPQMSFLSKTKYDAMGNITFDGAALLKQVRNSLFVLISFYPLWIWFSTSYRNGNAGGKGSRFSIIDWISSGPMQLGWAAIVMLVIVPHSDMLQANFALAYFIFFLSDIIKCILMEIAFYKDDKWLHSITRKELLEEEASAEDISIYESDLK